jgi:tryptophan synthase alpha subunit
VARIADGVIVGSALVRAVATAGSAAVAAGAFVAALRAAMDGGRG